MRKDDVIALIEQAFADTVYPDDGLIDADHCPECAEIYAAFRGKQWESFTDVRLLREHYLALSSLYPASFRYYLPAFMRAALVDPETADVILDGLEYHLSEPKNGTLTDEEVRDAYGYQATKKYWLQRVSGFTAEQKQAIKAYLEARYKRNPMLGDESTQLERQRALAFWDTFEG